MNTSHSTSTSVKKKRLNEYEDHLIYAEELKAKAKAIYNRIRPFVEYQKTGDIKDVRKMRGELAKKFGGGLWNLVDIDGAKVKRVCEGNGVDEGLVQKLQDLQRTLMPHELTSHEPPADLDKKRLDALIDWLNIRDTIKQAEWTADPAQLPDMSYQTVLEFCLWKMVTSLIGEQKSEDGAEHMDISVGMIDTWGPSSDDAKTGNTCFAVAHVCVYVCNLGHLNDSSIDIGGTFRDLLFGNLYRQCCWTIPFVPRYIADEKLQWKENENPENGGDLDDYRGRDGRVSKNLLLLAAVLQTPRRDTRKPFMIEEAWTWVARLINVVGRQQKDRPHWKEGFGFALVHFLETCQWQLFRSYGKRYVKLLKLLNEVYVPKLPQTEAVCKHNLKDFLDKKTYLIEPEHRRKATPDWVGQPFDPTL